MKKNGFLLITCLLSFSSVWGQGTQYDTNLLYGREFRSDGDTLQYQILYPSGYVREGKTKYPLVIFLSGESVQNQNKNSQSVQGATLFVRDETKKKYPAIVLILHCLEHDSWVEYKRDTLTDELIMPEDPEQTASSTLVQRLVRYYIKNRNADSKQIYLMGYSEGGMGVLDLVARNPGLFTAAASISGAIYTPRLKKLKKMPIRLYHGSADEEIPVSFSRDAFYELKAAGSRVAEIIEYPGVDHEDCLNLALDSVDFLEWFFSKKK